MPTPKERLEYLRGEIEAERISWSEIAELQSLAKHIDPGDTLLLAWAEEAKPTKFVVTLEVNVDLNGVPPSVIDAALRSGIQRMFDEGLVTGESDAVVDTWDVEVKHD